MKAYSNNIPNPIENIGGGNYYVNMDVKEKQIGDITQYEYEYVKVQGYPTYGIVVDKLIREKYTQSDELAIQRQRDTKPEDFNTYNDFCENCKEKARTVFFPNE